jgi:hypothetical protein
MEPHSATQPHPAHEPVEFAGAFQVEHTDIPPHLTIAEWRAQRTGAYDRPRRRLPRWARRTLRSGR